MVSREGGAVIVTGPEGTDRLVGMDLIRMPGGDVILNEHQATGSVAITGTLVAGHVVTAQALQVADSDGTGALQYQWFRSHEVTVPFTGETWQTPLEPIAGATGATYLITPADAGSGGTLQVRARFVDGDGNTESIWSGQSAEVLPPGTTTLQGTVSNDAIEGGSAAEWLIGDFGDDTLAGGGGNDTLAGGLQVDTAVMGVPLAQLQGVWQDWGGWVLDTAEGSVSIVGIERVRFDDAMYALDTYYGEETWQVEALLWAAFGAAPGTALLSQWVAAAADVPWYRPLADQAAAMLDYYAPGIDTATLVRHLFWTVGHMVPTQAQVDGFVADVGEGHYYPSNAHLLAAAAQMQVNVDRLAGFTGSIVPLDMAWF